MMDRNVYCAEYLRYLDCCTCTPVRKLEIRETELDLGIELAKRQVRQMPLGPLVCSRYYNAVDNAH